MLRIILFIGVGALMGAAMGYFGQCSSGACPLTSTWWRGALYGGCMGLFLALGSMRGMTPSSLPPRDLPADQSAESGRKS